MFRSKEKSPNTSFSPPEKIIDAGLEAVRCITPNSENHIRLKLVEVVYDEKNNGYSIAIGELEGGKRTCLIRWNGDYSHNGKTGSQEKAGVPLNGNLGVWFALPDFLAVPVLKSARDQAEHLLLSKTQE